MSILSVTVFSRLSFVKHVIFDGARTGRLGLRGWRASGEGGPMIRQGGRNTPAAPEHTTPGERHLAKTHQTAVRPGDGLCVPARRELRFDDNHYSSWTRMTSREPLEHRSVPSMQTQRDWPLWSAGGPALGLGACKMGEGQGRRGERQHHLQVV